MKPEEIREYSDVELEELEDELDRELFALRMQQATGQLQNTAALKNTRRDIARVKTIKRERELGIDQ